MRKNILAIIFLISLFVIFIFVLPKKSYSIVKEIISPVHFILENNAEFKFNNFDCFDSYFSEKNKSLATKLDLTEEEAFIIGNLAKQWTINLMQNRRVIVKNNNLYFLKYSFAEKFKYSAFCIKDSNFTNPNAAAKMLKTIRKSNYIVLDTDKDIEYTISEYKNINFPNYLVLRKNLKTRKERTLAKDIIPKPNYFIESNNVKLILSDSTTKLIPDRNCTSDICKEILSSIINAQQNIDIAIYGYTTTYKIEKAIKDAIARGVKVRLIYDTDSKGENIYPNTFDMVNIIESNKNDDNSPFTMHNKFYIFDDEKIITGSANLSHTDMSGYNSNSIVSIRSKEIAKIYKREFEQMYYGKFHNAKISFGENKVDNIRIYFSPQDKTINNAILPLIKQAKNYIYIPTFVITENDITQELINAKNRGVDVRIILDALSASNKHSKDKILRIANIKLKTENYAGKMHSKSIIIDDKYLVIGSMNLSNSGNNKNDENCLIINDSKIAKFYKEFFLYQWNKIPEKWLKYSARAESTDSIGSCSDGIDNDYDQDIDVLDSGCKNFK